MKRILLYFTLVFSSFYSYGQYTAIPDTNFEAALLAYDDVPNDDQILTANIAALTTLDVSNSNITDLTGIQDFVALESLFVHDNNISTIDLSNLVNLTTFRITRNQLTTLDLSNQPALQNLIADNNDIETLQINSAVLRYLQVFGNNLTDIDLSSFSQLEQLFIGENELTSLDVGNNTSLFRVEFSGNQLRTIDVTALQGLRFFNGSNNDLVFANIKNGNNPAIEDLQLQNNANLHCIQVDNATDAYAGLGNYAGWQIDGATSSYADQCLTRVPDDNFEQALIDAGYDTTGLDNFVPTANIASVVSFNAGTGGALYNKGITDLTGIEDFASLIQLWSDGNPLVSIDLSKNTALNTMALIGTALTDLDLSGNTQLFFAVVRDNNQLTSINLSANTLLTNLTIRNNLLSAIDLNTNTALTKLNINNSSLSSIDLSANVRLDRIFIKDTPLSSLDLNTNTALANLELDATALTSIDLSTNTALSQLIVNNSSLTSLDLSANTVLDYLECTNNLLSNLDLSNNVLLEELYLSDNELNSIDLSTNTVLNYLYCNDNELTSLDLNSNTNLMELEVKNNQLTFLNLKNGTNETADLDYFRATGNPNLSCIEVDNVTAANAGIGSYNDWIKDVTASYSESCRTYVPDDNFEQALIDLGYDSGPLDNYVPTANIAGLTELSVRYDNIVDLTGIQDFVSLTTLRCDNNDITSLDLSKNTALIDLRCHDNPLGTLDLSANTLLTRVDAFRAELTNINLTGLTQLSILKVSENLFSSIDLSTNTRLTELTISENNALTSIDLSSNTELIKLFAFECQLGSLDLSANTKIEVINVEDNLLTVLDISANAVLESLDIEDNQLTSIDLTANTALRLLWCDNNQLTSLDLSTNTNITRLECENNKLTSLNVKNGSSASISTLRSTSNFDLNCIEVDDPNAATTGTGNYTNWLKDDSTAYADGCVPFTYVPDDNFEQALIDLTLDDVLDNFVVTSNISGVTSLDLNTQSIADLTGIEDFAALTTINVNDNQLTRLDLKLNTALASIQANNNQLQFFSVKNGNNTNVTTFSATGNADLLCIEVDDETASYLSTWQKDTAASFGTVCTACVVDGTRIESKAEFDQFIALLGTCNTVNGDLTIRNANDITDISVLSGIEVINGKLFIGDNELITSLDGLENLKTVTDGINLSRNDVLNNISALSGIANPTVSITISGNTVLTDITTVLDFTVTELIFINEQTLAHDLIFPNVTTLSGTNTGNSAGPGSLNFREIGATSISFPNLTTIEHFFSFREVDVGSVSFPLLTNVGRSFTIDGTQNTTAFNFNALQTVDGFTLDETSVTDLSSFAALTSVGTYLSINNNPNLISLDALSNIASTSGIYLYIRNNDALTSLEGLGFITGAVETITIEDNLVLTNIDALEGVTTTERFSITDNAQLTNIDGLRNITETTETETASYLQSTISGNAITSLNLTSLRSVGNQLNIVETGVTNFCGLYSYVADGDGQTTLNLTGSAFTIADILNCENVAPVITLLGDNPQTIELGSGYTELGAITDDGSTIIINATDFIDAVGNYTITYNATNVSGMASAVEVIRTVNVVDTTNPIAICQDRTVFLNPSGNGILTAAQIDNGSSDLSGISTFSVIPSSFSMVNVGMNTVTLTVTDNNRNIATCTSTVTVVDAIPPTMACQDITVQLDATGNVSITASQVDDGTFDASGIASLHIDITDFDRTNIGENMVTLTVTDNNGNSDTCIATVTVEDNIAPVITLIGDNPQVIELGSGYTELGATTDDGSEVVIDTSDFADAVGNYTITYNVTDTSGNMAVQATRSVTVVDTTNPTVICQNIIAQLDDTGNVMITTAQIDNGSTDISGIVSFNLDVTAFDCANIGDNTVSLTVTDANGNSNFCTATVTIEDSIDPVFDVATLPGDIQVPFDTDDMYTLADFTVGVEVTDNCDTNRSVLTSTITQSPVAGTLLGAGDHIITLTATDANSNEENVTFIITVSNVLSLEENEQDRFAIYPNPAKQQFQVSGFSGEAELSIYDVNGRSLLIEKVDSNRSISIHELPNGVYFVKIAIGTTYQTIKLLKTNR
ncbi:immunoglobulin-like domain-containing protein [uncultured Aquimarina sp.]|uniref:HYR domain-containing protein n=1 Tax=uncultured Aquimarina sp. TaxID=575652 RepID=UPI002603DBA2|nr:immunoglobulin-like domain-containing protein [uncultured Aquimarina sp.]